MCGYYNALICLKIMIVVVHINKPKGKKEEDQDGLGQAEGSPR